MDDPPLPPPVSGPAEHLARARSWAPPAAATAQPWTPAAAAAAAPSPSPPRAVPAWPAGGPRPTVTPPSGAHAASATPFAVAHAAFTPATAATPPPPPAALAAVARASAALDRKARLFVDDAAFLAEIGTGRCAAPPPPGLDVRAAVVELGARFARFEAAFRAELATAAAAAGVSLDQTGGQSGSGVVLAVPPALAPVKTSPARPSRPARPASPPFFSRRPGSGSLWGRRRGQAPTAAAGPVPAALVRPPSAHGPLVREVAPGVVVRSDLPPPADDSPAGTPGSSTAAAATTPKERVASVWRRLSKGGGVSVGAVSGGAPGTPGMVGGGPAVPTLSTQSHKFLMAGVGGAGVIPGFGVGGGLAAHRPHPGAGRPA
jgi:hypothetical protein